MTVTHDGPIGTHQVVTPPADIFKIFIVKACTVGKQAVHILLENFLVIYMDMVDH